MRILEHSSSFLAAACAVAFHVIFISISISAAANNVVAVSAASESHAATRDLIAWIRSKEGGLYNPKQEEKAFGIKSRGIFAAEDIAEGEILLQVPWDSILGADGATPEVLADEIERRIQWDKTADDDESFMTTKCRAYHNVHNEVLKGEASEFATHLKYLSLIGDPSTESETNMPTIPAAWSQEGRDLLEDINDKGMLPPVGLFTVLNYDWYGACIKDIKNNPLQARVAAVVAAHGSSGEVLSEVGILVPLFDNYHYNHRLVGATGDCIDETCVYINAQGIVDYGESFRLVATHPIPAGEQIFRAYGNFHFDDATQLNTLNYFREYGIVDDLYPKCFEFDIDVDGKDEFPLEIDVDESDDGNGISILLIENPLGDVDEEAVVTFFEQELNRLQRLKAVAMRSGIQKIIPPHEWETAWQYHRNLVKVMSITVQDIRLAKEDDSGGDSSEEEDDSSASASASASCPGGFSRNSVGSCPIWDGFQALPSTPIQIVELEYVPGAYGPSEDSYAMCNDVEGFGVKYVKAGDVEIIKSRYQEIRFFTNPETKDMVMKLDTTVQQTSDYRPHYHEFAVHYPARFLESVKRVLFVGGGDSMVLHEVLKYPSLEQVVGLELDQYVLRNSFRYFNTQPHFDDKRVEWWFGDGAKSLLMLPKSYFQSFDLVVVDLSETVMSFQVTDKLSIFQTLSLLLKPEGIMLKNGEYYMEKMSQYFDHTLQYFEYDVPFICDQGMVIGSNKIDFFNRTMKDHGVELLVLESQDEINEKYNEFYRFTEYRKNDARKQGHCGDFDSDDGREGKNAGILMVVEAENVKHDLTSIDALKATIGLAITNLGFDIVSTAEYDPSTIVMITKEGYFTVRLFPEKSYVGLDIHFWANFDMMEAARDAVVESLGGTDSGTSSFRIVTGGMSGSPFQELDQSKTGPIMVNARNCDPDSSPASVDKSVDLATSALQGSLELFDDDGVVAVVLCGVNTERCQSVIDLKQAPGSKLRKVVPVYTCASLRSSNAEFSPDIDKKMAACEVELSDVLSKVGDKISLLVIDDGAKQIMGKVILSIFSSVFNRKRLFSQQRFALFVDSSTDAWRRNLLALIRLQITFKPMSVVDMVVENPTEKSKFSILSLYDPDFFLHLKGMVDTFNQSGCQKTRMEVESVFDGLIPPQIGHFNPKKFKDTDYDQTPAQEQHAGQTSLGRQSLLQFELKSGINQLTASNLEKVLKVAINVEGLEFTSVTGKDTGIGDGLVVVAVSADTHAIVVWDGVTHIDVNLYSRDENPQLREEFTTVFVQALGKDFPVELTLSDTHPRGADRVVSFPGHMN